MSDAVDLAQIGPQLAPEWLKAECTGEACDRHWEATGAINCRRAAERAQRHANRTGHLIDLQWANRR
jgi:hypothetical protein